MSFSQMLILIFPVLLANKPIKFTISWTINSIEVEICFTIPWYIYITELIMHLFLQLLFFTKILNNMQVIYRV